MTSQAITTVIVLVVGIVVQTAVLRLLFKYAHRPLAKLTDRVEGWFDNGLLGPLIPIQRLMANLGIGKGAYLDLLGSQAEKYSRAHQYRKTLFYGELGYREWQRLGTPTGSWSLSSVHVLAGFYMRIERFEDAETVLLEALKAFRRAPRKSALPVYGELLCALGKALFHRGSFAAAAQYYEEAFRVLNNILGTGRMEAIEALAFLQQCKARLGDAQPLDEAQLEYLEHAFQNEFVVRRYFHLASWRLQTIGATKYDQGDYRGARRFWIELILLIRRLRGRQSIELTVVYFNLALCASMLGKPQRTVMWLKKVVALEEARVRAIFSVSDETKRLEAVTSLMRPVGLFMSVLQHWPKTFGSEDLEACFLLATRRKGLVAEAMLWQTYLDLSDLSPEHKELVSQLREAQSRVLEESSEYIEHWRQRENELAIKFEEAFPQFRLEERLRLVNATAIYQSLPVDTVLLDIFKLPWVQITSPSVDGRIGPRYCGFYVRREGVRLSISVSDFGEARLVDHYVKEWLKVTVRSGVDANEDRAAIDEWMWRTFGRDIVEKCAGASKIRIAPDSQLSGIPFEALHPPLSNDYILNSLEVSYLSAGRDLLRHHQGRRKTGGTPLFVGVSCFDSPKGEPSPYLHLRSGAFPSPDSFQRASIGFEDIRGTRIEVKRIHEICSGNLLLDQDATVSNFLAHLRPGGDVTSPAILHVATHGWAILEPRAENPLRFTGIALFGAKNYIYDRCSGVELLGTGLVTGLDVLRVDLHCTELAVLSACQTGVGHVVDGEGVLGLQRSFVLAGAATVVMSLWNVPDNDTALLMARFYAYLAKGLGKSEALNRAKLSIRKMGGRMREPRAWAGFVLLGDESALSDQAIKFFRNREGRRAG